ncbi:SRPBCC family protein [Haloarchaeobius amylolyticus]|uniref:SRPBCC family protein n=1 Tax=Haloarchaeobius amylolyticus TaxID=1198296 RepID=UPI00226F3C46|nr:SRPBCC domain-containing protein [Haloarchaeobius amylolyticus]
MAIDLDIFESQIEHETVYEHPPERVWQALTESDLLAAWLMENDLDEMVEGETFQFEDDPVPLLWDGTVECEVLEVTPPERLKISWDGGGMNPETTVTWELESVDGGTRLRLAHEGLDGLRGLIMKTGLRGGWQSMHEKHLPELLDRVAAGETPGKTNDCSSHRTSRD